MSQIITYLLVYNQYLLNQIYELTLFIAKFIPLKQWAFDDSKSPSYQKFIAGGYTAYPLASQQFKIEKDWDFDITQVIGLTNDDAVSKQYRPFKQKIERLNRTFKASYRVTCGYGTDDGAYYILTTILPIIIMEQITVITAILTA